ncbi:hypothetical protein WH06_15080, partial [Aeromonas salmonicida subsp. salmonicida]
WELRQIFTKLQMAGAAQFTRAQLFQSIHNRFSILMTALTAQRSHQRAPDLSPAVLKGGIIENSGRRSPLLLPW